MGASIAGILFILRRLFSNEPNMVKGRQETEAWFIHKNKQVIQSIDTAHEQSNKWIDNGCPLPTSAGIGYRLGRFVGRHPIITALTLLWFIHALLIMYKGPHF